LFSKEKAYRVYILRFEHQQMNVDSDTCRQAHKKSIS